MYKSNNPFRPIQTQVLDVITETPTIKTLKLKPHEPLTFDAGQFIELTVPGVGEAPFTPSSNPTVKEVIEISVMRVGKVTEKIHNLRKGDTVGLRGPFGTKYPLDQFKGKEVLIVGGGCGLAPIRSLVYECFNHIEDFKKVVFRGGCRNPKEFLYIQEIQEWIQRGGIDIGLTVDEAGPETGGDNGNGWKGSVGVVTTILEDLGIDCASSIAVVCGPPVMMKFAVIKLLKLGFVETNMYLSMEKNMSCGLGKCGHCRIGTYYACKDGPVFRYDLIQHVPHIWD